MVILWIALAMLVVWTTIEGFRHGIVRRVVELVGLILIFFFASALADALEPVLVEEIGLEGRVAFFAAWVVVILGGTLGVRLLAVLAQKAVRLSITGWIDRLGGALLGAVFGVFLSSCALILITRVPAGREVERSVREEPLAEFVLEFAPSVYDAVRGVWDGERFFELIDDEVKPRAKDAVEQIQSTIEEVRRGDDAS